MCPKFFENGDSCSNLYSNFDSSRCSCGDLLSDQIPVSEEDQVGEVIGDSADGVFVSCRFSFILTDDSKVIFNSIGGIMKVLNDQGYHGFSDLQETLLDVGFEEVHRFCLLIFVFVKAYLGFLIGLLLSQFV